MMEPRASPLLNVLGTNGAVRTSADREQAK